MWNNPLATHIKWSNEISNIEAKQHVADQIAQRAKDGDVIGIGSGSTAFLALQSIAQYVKEKGYKVTAIPTSQEVMMTCTTLGIPTTTLATAKPDWAFDGADEVDPNHNLIKGRGGAMFHEKLVMASSPENYILIDQSKFVNHLGQKFPVPIEVDQRALHLVETKLSTFPVEQVQLRQATAKDGPVITEAGNLILDVHFSTIDKKDEVRLAGIPGVIETGLFIDYDVNILSI
ncbi:ribose 5-phosphate isomerase A [Pontibacillus yanchengensis]|uniref:Ribose 5-phosphate isomerase A n=2 Tax=Pontibacillus yanchengensis TaxID=462910 RepID=A0ACC7VBZ7_9BACI|nr:ribose 5-phosphate isomerase A [Pontibacillus yanchengensis]MYL35137.1 ribose 5-phosphate isomerase A [Pontibacillus yanchengensis]MYL52496.1 ribose 5-phosphate isomerase A [Pontibacillus yanchengensis]